MTSLTDHIAIAEVHAAQSTSRFGKAMFDLVAAHLSHQMLFVAFLPVKFELPCMVSREQFKAVCDDYIRKDHKNDIWMKRSPIGADTKIVRHSDYTPQGMLRRSIFYRQILKPMNGEYGASMTAWHGTNWLATFTMLKNLAQGDFTDEEMQMIAGWQVHFEAVARRLAFMKEERLDDQALSTFIWDLPISVLLLDWDLTLKHHNAAALELCNVWRFGLSAFHKKSSHQIPRVPNEILNAIPALKPQIEAAKLARPGPLKRVEFQTFHHPAIEGLSAKLYFIPSKSLSISRGRFLIQFYYHKLPTISAGESADLSTLSRRERVVAVEAARGLTNNEIGKVLRRSSYTVKVQLSQVLKKLNLRSRVELATLMAANPVLNQVHLASQKRSRRDSNPRYGFKAVQRFSKPSPSATRPQLLDARRPGPTDGPRR